MYNTETVPLNDLGVSAVTRVLTLKTNHFTLNSNNAFVPSNIRGDAFWEMNLEQRGHRRRPGGY